MVWLYLLNHSPLYFGLGYSQIRGKGGLSASQIIIISLFMYFSLGYMEGRSEGGSYIISQDIITPLFILHGLGYNLGRREGGQKVIISQDIITPLFSSWGLSKSQYILLPFYFSLGYNEGRSGRGMNISQATPCIAKCLRAIIFVNFKNRLCS